MITNTSETPIERRRRELAELRDAIQESLDGYEAELLRIPKGDPKAEQFDRMLDGLRDELRNVGKEPLKACEPVE